MLPRTRAKTACTAAWHGFDKTVFDMGFEGDDTLVLTAASPDGTDGFPGNAELEVRYSLAGTGLMIQYTLTTDAPTVANITNHSYFNLNGHASGSVLGHRLSLAAPAYLETDAGSIPTGRKIAVAGTPMDFTEEKTPGRDINADYPCSGAGQRLRPVLHHPGQRPAPRRLGYRPRDRHSHGGADHPARHALVHRQLSGTQNGLQG